MLEHDTPVAPAADKTGRLAAVARYEILDAPRDGTFDRVARLAASAFGTPIATVTIVDADRVWFAACEGLEGVAQIGTEPGLCASAVLQDDFYVVNDAALDPRTLGHPLVRGELGLRFYAAAPIITSDGYRLGTVNVIDREPREVTPEQTRLLEQLAGLVMDHLELRLSAIQAVRAERKLARAEEERSQRRAQLIAQLREAADAGHSPEHPATCQLGGRGRPCERPAEVKLADGWGDSAWGCMRHAENLLLDVSGVFLADHGLSGLAPYVVQ
ncbi:MAG TPA: GAF domain-containing protein [Planosporangium sp.]|jgi:GAF domain-containing protein|nr:GAF domain-containing protein [Planosporangium sp.]